MFGFQELTGLDLAIIFDDPDAASVHLIVLEAMSHYANSAAFAGFCQQENRLIISPWISTAPITIKMRLFCLPYAGGVSENVYGRCAKNQIHTSPQPYCMWNWPGKFYTFATSFHNTAYR